MTDKKNQYTEIESVDEFLRISTGAVMREENQQFADKWEAAPTGNGYNSYEWLGLTEPQTMQQVERTMREGWTKGVERINSALKTISPQRKPQSFKRSRARGEMGDSVDMTRVWSGNLDTAWHYMKKAEKNGTRHICIVTDSILSGGDDADDLFWTGAAAVKAADLLSEAGYTVAVKIAFQGRMGNQYFRVKVTAKDYDAPMDISTLSSAAHPAFFRLFGHRYGAVMHESQASSGYNFDGYIAQENEILCAPRSQDAAEKWLLKLVRQLDKLDQEAA